MGTNRFEGTRIIGGGAYIGGAGARLKVVDLNDVAEGEITGFPSAMSLYAPGKPDLVCPEFVQGLRTDWTAAVDTADAIAIIGARPMFESDPHIWDPIQASDGQVGLIGGEADTLQGVFGPRFNAFGETFAEGLGGLREWLVEQANS